MGKGAHYSDLLMALMELNKMTWNIGIDAKDSNLFGMMKQNERQQRKNQLRKLMPHASDVELDGYID